MILLNIGTVFMYPTSIHSNQSLLTSSS
jgi:hypothetical protein